MQSDALCAVNDLCVSYRQEQGRLQVVWNVNFTIRRGEVLRLVGESGCGSPQSRCSFSVTASPAVESMQAVSFWMVLTFYRRTGRH